MPRTPAAQQHLEVLAMALGKTTAELEADGQRYVRSSTPSPVAPFASVYQFVPRPTFTGLVRTRQVKLQGRWVTGRYREQARSA